MFKNINLSMCIVSIFLVAVIFCSCSDNKSDMFGSSTGIEGNNMVNPCVEVDSASDFLKLGYLIDAPEGSEKVNYMIIDDEVAEVDFSYASCDYCYRASKSMGGEILAGIYYDKFESEYNSNLNGIDVNIKVISSSEKLATWYRNEVNYSLYEENHADESNIFGMCERLINM